MGNFRDDLKINLRYLEQTNSNQLKSFSKATKPYKAKSSGSLTLVLMPNLTKGQSESIPKVNFWVKLELFLAENAEFEH